MTTESPPLKYVICFAGNNQKFVDFMVNKFLINYARIKGLSIFLCEPIKKYRRARKFAKIKGLIPVDLPYKEDKLVLIKNGMKDFKNCVSCLIVNSIFHIEEAIYLQNTYKIEPYILEILDVNRYRQIEKPYWPPIRSSMQFTVHREEDLKILLPSVLEHLFSIWQQQYTESFEKSLKHNIDLFNTLSIQTPRLFLHSHKNVYLKNGQKVCVQKPPNELEDSVFYESE